LCRELGDQYHQAEVLAHLADTLCALGSAGEARDARVAALGILGELGHPRAEEMRARLGLVDCECRAGDRTSNVAVGGTDTTPRNAEGRLPTVRPIWSPPHAPCRMNTYPVSGFE